MSESLSCTAFARTDTGCVRTSNEDCVYLDAQQRFGVLADGMGGAAAGEIASALAVETFRARLSGLGATAFTDEHLLSDALHQAMEDAHARILAYVQDHPRCKGMGSTLVAVVVVLKQVLVVHAGDSRLYRCRGGELTQLTRDHSLVQQQFEQGLITADERKTSRHKNIITHALGVDLGVDIACARFDVQAGDQFLLCSDGLNDMVADAEIAQILQDRAQSVAQRGQALIDAANAHGGRDNVSIILLTFAEQGTGRNLGLGQRIKGFVSWFR